MAEIRTVAPKRKSREKSEDFPTFPGERAQIPDGKLEIGALLLQRYKIIAELGQGGMGIVYKCFDEIAGIEVALKALPPELSRNVLEMEDIKQNFQLVAKLVHQNIAVNRMLERDPATGDCYLIMEYVEGEDLYRWFRRKKVSGPLGLEQVLPVVRQVAAALDYAHEQRVMHRDIKPGNIMIGPGGMIKVLDFGLAAQIHSSMSRTSRVYRGTSGTGPYMAPEQWRGRAQGASADQYALGVMTYELLAGHLPFESNDPVVLKQAILDEEPQKIPGLPKHVQAAIERAMSKDPYDRFHKCSDFVNAMAPRKIGIRPGFFIKLGIIAVVAAVLCCGLVFGWDRYAKYQHQKQQAELQAKAEKKRLEEKARAEAEREAREKEKIGGLKKQCEVLKSACQDVLREVEISEIEQTKKFERNLENLKKFDEKGRAAFEKSDFVTAYKEFSAAEKYRKWIGQNLPLCISAHDWKHKVFKSQAAADKFEASKFAAELYAAADNALKQGEKEYFEKDDYAASIASFESADSQFKKVVEESRNAFISNALSEAETAGKKEDWEKVRKISDKIRTAAPENAEKLARQADAGIKIKRMLDAARRAMKAEKWAEASKLLSDIIAQNKNNSQAVELKKEVDRQLKIHAAHYRQQCARDIEMFLTTFSGTKEEIEAMGLDRGQTFGKRLDALKESFDKGVELKNTDPVEAWALLKKAEAVAKWIRKNIPLRDDARNLIVRVGEIKEDADKFSASQVASVSYDQGVTLSLRGDREYEAGEFELAVQSLHKAAEAYEEAYKESKKIYAGKQIRAAEIAVKKRQWESLAKSIEGLQRVDEEKAKHYSKILDSEQQIEKLISEAQEFAVLKEWEKVLAVVNRVLKINPHHSEALELKREIEAREKAGVKFIVTFNGRTVKADVLLEGEKPDKSGKVITLKQDREYRGNVKYQYYSQPVNFKLDTPGIRTLRIAFGEERTIMTYKLPRGARLNMVRVKAGSFMMGSPRDEEGHTNMETLHKVTLNDDFWIGQFEVTQEQYEAVTDYKPAWFKGAKRPVEGITWQEASDFCRLLNQICGSQLPRGYKFDLPTEAQWEYACRAQTVTPLNNGRKLVALDERCYNLDDVAWYKYNHSIQGHQDVGRKKPNKWKIYDMHGNVAEWCRDGYGFYSSGEVFDPLAFGDGRYHVYRGGSWKSEPVHCRSAQRNAGDSSVRSDSIGFRVAIVRK